MREWKHFHHRPAVELVILDDLRRRAGGRLILSHRADPGIEPGDRPRERLDLANGAAAVRVRLVQRTWVGQGLELYEIEAVPLGELLFERVRLGEMEAGVEEDHRHRPVDAAEQVREYHAAPTEAHRQGRLSRERVYRPRQGRLGIGTPQGNGPLANLRGAKHRSRSG